MTPQDREQMAMNYRAVFSTEAGRAVLADLCGFAGLGAELAHLPAVTDGDDGRRVAIPADAHATYHALGQRRTVLRILSFLKIAEEDAALQRFFLDPPAAAGTPTGERNDGRQSHAIAD